jgi:hypothetical protein
LFFCADTEEGTVTGNKRHVQKLYPAAGDDWEMIIATAGHGALCDMAAKQIIESARESAGTFLLCHREIIEEHVSALYRKYVDPYPTKDYRHFALIVGLLDRAARKPYLYLTEHEILQPRDEHFACAGVGETIGYYYLDRLFRDERLPYFSGRVPTIHEAQKLLRYVMKEAKLHVGGVGGSTIFSSMPLDGGMTNGNFGAGWEGMQPNLQDLIRHFWLDNPDPSFPTPSVPQK